MDEFEKANRAALIQIIKIDKNHTALIRERLQNVPTKLLEEIYIRQAEKGVLVKNK